MLAVYVTVIILLAMAGAGEHAWGTVYLKGLTNLDAGFSQFRIEYIDSIEYEYGEGSLLHQYLGGKQWMVEGTSSEGQDVQKLMNLLNEKIASDGSRAKISVLEVGYEFHLAPTNYGSVMERMVVIEGNLTDYVTRTVVNGIPVDPAASVREDHARGDSQGGQQSLLEPDERCLYPVNYTLVDTRWMGMTVTDDVVIDGVPINVHASLLREMEPDAYDLLAGTDAERILLQPLMGIEFLPLPLAEWRYLFYPAGTDVDFDPPGLKEGFTDMAVTMWEVGNLDPIEETTGWLDWEDVTLDQTYTIANTHSRDRGIIQAFEIGASDTRDGVETIRIMQNLDKFSECYTTHDQFWDRSRHILTLIVMFLVVPVTLLLIVVFRKKRKSTKNNDRSPMPFRPPVTSRHFTRRFARLVGRLARRRP